MHLAPSLAFAALLLSPLAQLRAATPAGPAGKPNIVLILADDLGYSDLGCYGGEIQTPNLDKLAAGGLRFTQFYNGARCCPSRASILTGLYPHEAGFPGMGGRLPANCATIPEVLRASGYRTFMSGKWHLGTSDPIERGFDEFYGMLGGFGSFWNPKLYTRLPHDRPEREYAAGKFYATDVITDHALDFIASARKAADKPFFLYLAYNAPHFPLHAPKEEIAKYAKLYEQGWDKIRETRYARQKQIRLIDERWPLTPLSTIPPNGVATQHGWSDKANPPWDSLPEDRRMDLARRMAVFAAAVDRMDQNIGRVIADLKQNGQLDNTLIFFLSDNGACAEWDPFGFDVDTGPKNILHTGADLDSIGAPGSYNSYGSGWANAGNTPFRLYKHYSHEGGISTPLIVHWPAGMKLVNELDQRPGHISDLLPTCLDAAGSVYPRDAMPLAGRSLLPALRGEAAEPRTIFFEHENNRAVRSGKWKLVSLAGKPWELYEMETDRVELKDLAAKDPERVKDMSTQWETWKKRMSEARKSSPPVAPDKPKPGAIHD
jgi:arylsulfatase A-like enzyme